MYAHLPGYSLAADTAVELDPGRLSHLTWEAWRAIDDDYPYQEGRFKETRPLFLVVEDDQTDGENLQSFLTGTAALVHHALTLRKPHCPRVPAPIMSMGYHKVGPAVRRVVGPLEREAIVWGLGFEPSDPLTDKDLVTVRFLLRLLKATPAPSGASILLDALEATGRPDIDRTTGFVLCIAALEAALLPDETSELRAKFARRVAAMGTRTPEEFAHLHDYALSLYRLRSELVHGGVKDATLERLELPSIEYVDAALGRDVIRPVVIRLAALSSSGRDMVEITGLLDSAAATESELDALNALVNVELRRYV